MNPDAAGDAAALLDIELACERAQSFAVGMTLDQFRADTKTHSAVLYQLLIAGEAVRRVSASLQQSNPHVPWRPIVGLRNRVVHQYDSVDLDLIWDTVQRDVPELRRALASLLPRRP